MRIHPCHCIAAAVAVFWLGSTAEAALPAEGVVGTPSYWMHANGDVPLLTPEQTKEVNHRIAAHGGVHDLVRAPKVLPGEEVRRRIHAAAQDLMGEMPALYDGELPLSAAAWAEAHENCAEDAVPARAAVGCAIAIRRTDVRLLPTADGWYETPGDTRYDMVQGTVLDPGEAVRILHRSRDGAFLFIETRDYDGWANAADLIQVERSSWLSFAAPEHFVTVMADGLQLPAGGRELHYQLGAKIPAKASSDPAVCRVLLPLGNAGGRFMVGQMDVRVKGAPLHSVLSEGRLPLTHNNLIRLAFAPLGTEYGWGGADGGMDCSSYVQNVYRAMGVELPRDADAQERALPCIPLAGRTHEQRLAILQKIPPGALLFLPGHVMLYLGTDAGGIPYVIHDISSCYEGGQKHYIRQVLVSDLEFQNARGTAAIDMLTHIGFIAPAS